MAGILDQQQLTYSTELLWGDNGAANNRSQVGQFFKPSINQTFAECHFWMMKNGSPADSVQAELYNASLSGGVLTVGSLIATSNNSITGSTLPAYTSGGATEQVFTFTGSPILGANYYMIALKRTGALTATDEYAAGATTVAGAYANGQYTPKLATTWQTANIAGSVNLTFKTYYKGYDTTKNIGQSLAYNGTNSAFMATVLLQPTETLPTGTSIAYTVQSDATTGFTPVAKNVESALSPPTLSATSAHKWQATFSGGGNNVSAINTGLNIVYRKGMPVTATTDRLAQSFTPSANLGIASIDLNIAKSATDTIDYTVEIQTDTAGSPSGTVVTNGSTTILAANVPVLALSGFTWTTAIFATPPTLTASTRYWIVVRVVTAGSSSLIWRARGGTPLPGESSKFSTNSGTAYTTMTNDGFLFRAVSGANTFSNTVSVSYKRRWL